MAAPSSRRSSGPVIRSLSPSGKFYSSPTTPSSSSSAFASYSSSFSARSSTFLHRSASPTRVNLYNTSSQAAPSVRFSLDHRPTSPSRSISAVKRQTGRHLPSNHNQKRTCMCSPTNHPGSFRCSLHKNCGSGSSSSSSSQHSAVPYSSNRLNARRSAMTNSLVRIGTVEGDLVKRALAALIRPSSHHQRRRAGFQPRASRLSVMSTADDL